MYKKIISLLTILSMTLVLFTGLQISVSAETLTGSCGAAENEGGENSVTWSLDTESGVLTISGKGDMYNYNYTFADNLPWYNSRSTITNVVIEDGVTSIGGYAFQGASNLTSIEIPSTVEFIGIQTFYGCKKLTSITIPESVTYISGNAFNECSMLETIFYPNTCELHENAFRFGSVKTLIKYTVTDGKVTISAITDKDGNDISGTVEIPTTIDGMDVVAVAEDYQDKVDTTKHTTHTYVNGECTICGTADPNAGNDDDNNEDNNDDSSISLSVENNTLTISGTGAVDDLSDLDGKESIKDVVIEDGITSVGDGAFDGFENLETVYYPKDTAVSDNAFPEDVTQVEYSVNGDGDVIIEDIKQGDVISDGDKVVIPDKIGGKDVAGVAEEVKHLVSDTGHEHKGGTATCSALAVCSVCASEYGELDPNYHTYVNGVCTGCNAADPDAEPVVTEPTVTEPTGSSPTGTSPVGSTPVIPSRPSAPSNPSSPAVTTAAAETTTVTVTTAEEIIADNDYTGEDVSAGAADNSDDGGITDMSMAVIILAIAAVIVSAVLIKKLIF